MRKLERYLGVTWLIFLLGVVTACRKDDLAATADADLVNITVNIGSRSGVIDTDNTEVLPDEGIKTLRLILVQDGIVISNSLHDFTTAEKKPLLKQGIRIMGLKQADTNFYAVVNEESADITAFDTSFLVGDSFNEESLMSIALQSGDATFPRTDISEKGLPMQGKISKMGTKLVEGTNVVIPVERIVARIDLNLVNKTGSELSIRRVNFGSFFPGQTHLGEFSPGNYQSKSFDEQVSIPAGVTNNSHQFIYYLYESQAVENYTISLNDGREYGAVPILVDGQKVTELMRNHILSITATVNSTGWELTCNVNPWDKEEINISFEDNLSYSAGQWTEGTYIELLEENTVHLSPDQTAELIFTIQTPSGAKWRASLEGDINAFEFVGPSEGIAGVKDENGKVPTQTIKLKVKDPASEERHEAQLHVFAYIGSKDYELDLTKGSNTTSGSVNYFTILQSR